MIVDLKRSYMTNDVTLGMLQIDCVDHDPIYTLENPWVNNQTSVSCIPKGSYKCAPYSSAKYPDVYEVLNVPDRTYILFHWGNYERNTRGCILLGLGSAMMSGEPAIQSSRNGVEYFKELIGDNEFTLNIGD